MLGRKPSHCFSSCCGIHGIETLWYPDDITMVSDESKRFKVDPRNPPTEADAAGLLSNAFIVETQDADVIRVVEFTMYNKYKFIVKGETTEELEKKATEQLFNILMYNHNDYLQHIKDLGEASTHIAPRVVVAAACKANDMIFVGARHFDPIMHSQIQPLIEAHGETWWRTQTHSQGFITNKGEYVTREEALAIARSPEANQINRYRPSSYEGGELFSEDLY